MLRTDHLQETYILRTDNLQETHAQNRSSTGNTCSEQIIYRKHMLRNEENNEKNYQNKSVKKKRSQNSDLLYRDNIIRTDHLEKTHDQDGTHTDH